MTMKTQTMQRLLLGALAISISACGGSKGDLSGTGDKPEQPRSKTGPITGFGSIIVAGEVFATGSSQFQIAGQAGSEEQLQVGMFVQLDVDEAGSLTRVSYDETLLGPISAIDRAADQLTVLQQTVLIEGQTNFENTQWDLLQVGAPVEISASIDSQGRYRASFIRPRTASTQKIQGRISQLQVDQQRFMIQALVVDYAQASNLALAGDTLRNDQLVEVEGAQSAQGPLIAERIEALSFAAAESVIESIGLITSLADNRIELNQQSFLRTASTRYLNLQASDLRLDLPVQVIGESDSENNLVASEIRLLPQADSEIEGIVESVDADQAVITLLNRG